MAGSGRSGTSTFAGVLRGLGLYVPQPEVPANETNPRGFVEPQWVVDFHNGLLKRSGVLVSDARPQAGDEARKAGSRAGVGEKAAGWLSEQARHADGLVIKDPRLAWFAELWRDTATRCALTPGFATMLRPPMEVIGSKQVAYRNRVGDVDALAAWVNLMLQTERTTRGTTRVFVRYHDLLDDWETCVGRAGEALGLPALSTVDEHHRRRVDAFIDPSLSRMQRTWEDFEGPQALRDVAEGTWEQLDRLAEPGGEVNAVYGALDELSREYSRLYVDSEAIARSTTIAATRRARARAAGRRGAPRPASIASTRGDPSQTPVARAAARIPRWARAAVPRRLRAGARRALGSER